MRFVLLIFAIFIFACGGHEATNKQKGPPPQMGDAALGEAEIIVRPLRSSPGNDRQWQAEVVEVLRNASTRQAAIAVGQEITLIIGTANRGLFTATQAEGGTLSLAVRLSPGSAQIGQPADGQPRQVNAGEQWLVTNIISQ
jgi:hypothetical protein